jgi:hypothetical protein
MTSIPTEIHPQGQSVSQATTKRHSELCLLVVIFIIFKILPLYANSRAAKANYRKIKK